MGSRLPSAETTILIVAQHALVRAGLRAILSANPGFSVIEDVRDAAAAAHAAGKTRPDVVLMGEVPSIEQSVALSQIKCASPMSCILCLGEATDGGVCDVFCVPAEAGVGELCSVLDAALGGRCAGCSFRAQCPGPRVGVALSRRERQVAVCVAEGMSSKQIAGVLGISLRTVNTYRESLARKIGASSGAVVTRYVLEHRLTALTASGATI